MVNSSEAPRAAAPAWRVTEAVFETSAPRRSALPDDGTPELAIAGRSNVGKSSLINALTHHGALARVSRAPGRTQLLNAFAWSLRSPAGTAAALRCVDLPGYGFARVTAAVRDGFAPMVEDYLISRAALRLVLVLVDCRREVDERDQSLLEFLASRKLAALVVGTKADKLGAAARGVWVARASAAASLPRGAVLLTAARTGLGIDGPRSLLDAIVRSCGLSP